MANSFRYLSWVVVAVVAGVLGWEGTPARGAEPEVAPVAFSVFARQRVAGVEFLPGGGKAPQRLEFFGNARSPLYVYRGGGRVPFYDAKAMGAYWKAMAENPRATPVLPEPVAVAEVPAGVERALFLFIPVRGAVEATSASAPGATTATTTTTAATAGAVTGARGVRFNVYVVDDSPRRLPAGYASVINASGRDYMAKVGERLLEVPQGVGGTVPVSGSVEVRLAAQTDGNWVVGGRHTFRLGEQERVSLVLFPPTSPTGVAPIIRTLIDESPDEAATASGTRVASAGR